MIFNSLPSDILRTLAPVLGSGGPMLVQDSNGACQRQLCAIFCSPLVSGAARVQPAHGTNDLNMFLIYNQIFERFQFLVLFLIISPLFVHSIC